MKLLTTKNAKIQKGRGRGYIIYGLHLLSGKTCARATNGCLRSCLNLVGNGCYPNVQQARARKTRLFLENPLQFVELLYEDIKLACKQAKHKKLIPAFRLNLTSDIPWECFGVPQAFPNVQFYCYTKYHDRHPPKNYHLTFSRSESLLNHERAKFWLRRGGNVAVIFKDEPPRTYWGYRVHSGEDNDLRFLDPFGVIGLRAKGKARSDATGLVVAA